MVEKGKELDAEIEEVTQKLADIRKELKVEVSDVSAEYDLSREQLVIMKTEATRLETELIDLRDEMESLESRFSNYRKSHPIN